MKVETLNDMLANLRGGDLTRRSFLQRAAAIGISAATATALVESVGAQTASPESGTPEATPGASPVAGGGGAVTRSITRDEYLAALEAKFAFE